MRLDDTGESQQIVNFRRHQWQKEGGSTHSPFGTQSSVAPAKALLLRVRALLGTANRRQELRHSGIVRRRRLPSQNLRERHIATI